MLLEDPECDLLSPPWEVDFTFPSQLPSQGANFLGGHIRSQTFASEDGVASWPEQTVQLEERLGHTSSVMDLEIPE